MFVAHRRQSVPALAGSEMAQATIKSTMIQPAILCMCKRSPRTAKGLPVQIMSSLTEVTGLACLRAPADLDLSIIELAGGAPHNHY